MQHLLIEKSQNDDNYWVFRYNNEKLILNKTESVILLRFLTKTFEKLEEKTSFNTVGIWTRKKDLGNHKCVIKVFYRNEQVRLFLAVASNCNSGAALRYLKKVLGIQGAIYGPIIGLKKFDLNMDSYHYLKFILLNIESHQNSYIFTSIN